MAWTSAPTFTVQVMGPRDSIAEVGEQLAWLGCALRSSPFAEGLGFCTASVSFANLSDREAIGLGTRSENLVNKCKIAFEVHKLQHLQPSQPDGQCWHELFRNQLVVEGYPILRRSESVRGLEIPLNILAALSGTERINIFGGIPFIKGFSSMLYPTECFENILLWHLLYNQAGNRIPFHDARATTKIAFNTKDISESRHIVGWCSAVKYYAGKCRVKE